MRGTDGQLVRSSSPRRGRWSQAERARLKELYGLCDETTIARKLSRPVASVRRMAEKIFPARVKHGPWTADEVLELKRYLGATTPEVIARVLGRDVREVQEQIFALGRVQRNGSWTRDELAELKRIYGTRADEDLALVFGRSVEDVRACADQHALAKDKVFLRRCKGEASTRMPRWTAQEIEILRQRYPSEPNLDIARSLQRSVKSVVSKAHSLGLKKSTERLRRMGLENVRQRYRR